MRSLTLLAPAGTIALALLFLYANPYQAAEARSLEASTVRIVCLLLVLPAAAAAVAFFIRSRWLKRMALIGSLPAGLYLGLAAIPSLWNLFIPFIAAYAFIPVRRD